MINRRIFKAQEIDSYISGWSSALIRILSQPPPPWADVVAEYSGLTLTEIKAHLDTIFVSDDNQQLACAIFDELN